MPQPAFIDEDKIVVKNKYFTLANFFSFSRIIVAPVIVWVHYHQGVNMLFTVLVTYAIVSDYLDGWAARSHDEVTELGKVIDPIADKVLAGILFFYAAWLGPIPFWFFWLCIGRDLLILAGSLYVRKVRGKVAMSVMSGKVFVNFLALYWIWAMFFPGNVFMIYALLIASTILLVGSFLDYVYRFTLIMKGAEFN